MNNFELANIQLASCYIEEKKYDSAETLLGKIKSESGFPEVAYLLAVIYAQKGLFEKAIEVLQKSITIQDDEKSKEFLFYLLMNKALNFQKNGNEVSANETISEAFNYSVVGSESSDILNAMSHYLPITKIKTGLRKEAASFWSEEMNKNPGNSRLYHNLALLYYWWALDIEESIKNGRNHKDSESINDIWTSAIVYWTALLNSDKFWDYFIISRKQVWKSEFPKKEIEIMRKKLMETKIYSYLDNLTDYYKMQKDEVNLNRIEHYKNIIHLENKSSKILKNFLNGKESLKNYYSELFNLDNYPGIGFFKINSLDSKLCDFFNEIEKNYKPDDNSIYLKLLLVNEYLSEILILADDRNQPQKALELLEVKKDIKISDSVFLIDSPAGLYVKAYILIKSAKKFFDTNNTAAAFKYLKEADSFLRLDAKQKEGMEKAFSNLYDDFINTAEMIFENEAKSKGKNKKYDDAINILKKGLEIIKSDKLIELIVLYYSEIAGIYISDRKFDDAIKYLEIALQYDKNNMIAKNKLSTAYNNKAIDISKKSSSYSDKAITLLEKAHEISPDDPLIVENLAGELNSKAVHWINNGTKTSSAIELLKKGIIMLNPELTDAALSSLAFSQEYSFNNSIAKISDGIYKTMLKNLFIAYQNSNYRRGY